MQLATLFQVSPILPFTSSPQPPSQAQQSVRSRPWAWTLLRPAALALLVLGATGAMTAQAKAPSKNVPKSPPKSSASDTSSLDAALFYQLLLGELQLRNNDPGSAFSLMLEAANKTRHQELYRRAVDIALQARSGNAALLASQDWGKAYPDNEDPHRYQLQILLALNRPADIAAPLRRLIDIGPPDKRNELINAIPSLLSRSSDKAAGIKAVRQALAPSLARKETAAAAWHSLGRLLLEQPDPGTALDATRRALQADPGHLPSIGLALELMEQGQTGAEALVRQYLARPTTKPEQIAHDMVQLGLARVFAQQRRHPEAQKELDALLTQRPDLPDAWLLQGALYQQQHDTPKAQAALEKFLTLSADSDREALRRGRTQAMLQLAQMAEQQQDYPGAQRWLDQITDPPDLLALQIRKATLLAKQGQLPAARALLDTTSDDNPATVMRKLMAQGQLLRDNGQPEEALKIYADASVQFPGEPDLIYEHAMTADKAGQPAEMERLLRQLIAIRPDHPHAYNALGYALADRNERLEEAQALIQKALTLAPKDAYIMDSLGWVNFRQGRLTEALRLLQDAYRLLPDAEIAAHLGEVLWAQGQQEQARARWREGLQINPSSETLLHTLQRLQVQP